MLLSDDNWISCHSGARSIAVDPIFKEVEHEWAVTGPEGTVAADGRGVPPARRQASRTRRSVTRTLLQALPLRTRTTRRSEPEEAEAAAEGSNGRHSAPPPRGRAVASGAQSTAALVLTAEVPSPQSSVASPQSEVDNRLETGD